MKIRPAEVEGFLRNPDARVRAVLVYGPDEGLVRERARNLATRIVDDLGDPFRVGEVSGASLKNDPTQLADEAAAMSLVGGRRVVRVRDIDDGAASAFEGLLDNGSWDALVIVEAGDLGPRSRLRKLFETADSGAAIACYLDDPRTLEALIRSVLAEHDLRPTEDAVIYLRTNLGSDRMVSRAELEKLGVYAANTGAVTLEDATACVGDSAATMLEDLANAVASRDPAAIDRGLGRALEEGTSPVAIIRVVSRHFQRLHLAAAMIADGRTTEEAMRSLRPPVFFKGADTFRRQLRAWTPADIGATQSALADAEILCKSTGVPPETACAEALMRLAGGIAASQR